MDAYGEAKDIVRYVILSHLEIYELAINDRWMDISIRDYWPAPIALWLQILKHVDAYYELPQDSALRLFSPDSLKDPTVRNFIDILADEFPKLKLRDFGPEPTAAAPTAAAPRERPGWLRKLSGFRFFSSKAEKVQPEVTIVGVFYATDRLQLPNATSDAQYATDRSPTGNINFGKCEVSIPKKHKVGKLEAPSILRLEFSPDPAKHIVLKKTSTLEENKFFQEVNTSVSKSAAKDAFVFVHGYNVSFEDAARRTGQIAYDLNFVGAPIFYSWPSNGKIADYTRDETNITWSTPHFQRFLTLLSQNSGAERIHIIAHSMGNRAVCEALKALSYGAASQLKFNHLVLAAPDIDADTFRELASTLQQLSARITLYESSKDRALLASKAIHGNPRAGEPLMIIPGLDTIDASAIDTNFLGHSYFSDNYPLLSDIHSILFRDEAASSRFGLHEMLHVDGRYYAFRA
jgi:esterase/lipase superfamily enzyme